MKQQVASVVMTMTLILGSMPNSNYVFSWTNMQTHYRLFVGLRCVLHKEDCPNIKCKRLGSHIEVCADLFQNVSEINCPYQPKNTCGESCNNSSLAR